MKIDSELKERLKNLAALRKRSPHWLMREAIAQYVEREEQHESFVAEAVAAWRDYRETGRHLTGEETDRWLRSWGTGQEIPTPECHE